MEEAQQNTYNKRYKINKPYLQAYVYAEDEFIKHYTTHCTQIPQQIKPEDDTQK